MTYRQIHTEIWDDDWTIDLEPPEKLLWIYLFSNSRTHYIGLYELPKKKASFDTGLPIPHIAEILARFEQAGKIKTNGSWVWVKNMLVRNVNNLGSPKIQTGILKAFRDVPNSCPFKAAWAKHYNSTIAPQFGIPTIPYDTISDIEAEADTFCSASALICPVSVSDLEPSGTTAGDVFLQVRGGAVNNLDIDALGNLIDECEEHRTTLPRGSPGADASGDDWVKAAILEGNASRNQGKLVSLNYISAILDRWQAEGFQAKWKGKDNEDTVRGL